MAHSPATTKRNYRSLGLIRDQGLPYHLGCAIKYICRAGYKDNYAEDLEKAIHYLTNEFKMSLLAIGYRIHRAYNLPNDLSRGRCKGSDRRGI